MQLAAAEKEVVLTSRLKEHESTLLERDALHEQLNEIHKELDLARKTITEQVSLSLYCQTNFLFVSVVYQLQATIQYIESHF